MVTLLRFNGEDRETGEFHVHGYTALLDNVNAAVLDVKLRHLPDWIAHRRRIASLYREALAGVGDLRLPHFGESTALRQLPELRGANGPSRPPARVPSG